MLTCSVQGFPAPAVTWYRRREGEIDLLLYPDNRTSISSEYSSIDAVTTSVLSISGALSSDQGDYVCEANNSLSPIRFSNLTVEIPGEC